MWESRLVCAGGFGLKMRTLGAQGIKPRDVEVPEDLQKEDRRRTLAVWRMLHEVVVAVAAGDRVAPDAGGGGEISERVCPARSGQRAHHVLGHLARIKAVASLVHDAAQHLGLPGRAEDLARGQRPAVLEVEAARCAGKPRPVVGPVEGHARGDGHALFGIADRGGEGGAETEPPIAVGQGAEGIDGARHRHGFDGLGSDGGHAPGTQVCGGEARGRTAGTVQRHDLFAPRGLQQNETVAADAAALRLRDAQKHGPGDGRIGSVAPRLQDVERDLRRQRV
jgi:hypothetical protein